MAKYKLKIAPTVNACFITEESPDFHGTKLILLDDGRVMSAPTESVCTNVGDVLIEPGTSPSYFTPRSTLEAGYEKDDSIPLA